MQPGDLEPFIAGKVVHGETVSFINPSTDDSAGTAADKYQCPSCGAIVIWDPEAVFDGEDEIWWSYRCTGCGDTFRWESELKVNAL